MLNTTDNAIHQHAWRDTPERYGHISRTLHWVTAILVLMQFLVVLAWRLFGETPATLLLSSIAPHGSVGLMILIVLIIRSSWAVANAQHRPPTATGTLGRLANIVHISFYVLLLLIPALALMRHYASGRALSFYGLELFSGAEHDIAWMIAPANLLHSPLSWLLLALIVGHITMALVHKMRRKSRPLNALTSLLIR